MSNPGARPRSYLILRGDDFAAAEERYMALREEYGAKDCARMLGLTPSAAKKFESARTLQRIANIPDSSCPAFARHDQHIAAAMEAGGFQTIVWRKTR